MFSATKMIPNILNTEPTTGINASTANIKSTLSVEGASTLN